VNKSPEAALAAFVSVALLAAAGCRKSTMVVADPPPVAVAEEPVATPPVVLAEPSESAGEVPSFAFPGDAAGEALSRLLTPGPPADPVRARRARPLDRSPPESIRNPALPLPAADPRPVGVPEVRPAVRPASPAESLAHLDRGALTGLPPPTLRTYPTPRVTADLAAPPPLPSLARPAPDRASLDDPTLESSAGAVTGAPLPERSRADPFRAYALPNPFEHADAVRTRDAPREELPLLNEPLPSPKQ
jgi:hypothetical protein